jgi:hypothetical protein
MKPAVVRSTLAFSAIVLALAGCLQEGGAISPSHAANAARGRRPRHRGPPPAATACPTSRRWSSRSARRW